MRPTAEGTTPSQPQTPTTPSEYLNHIRRMVVSMSERFYCQPVSFTPGIGSSDGSSLPLLVASSILHVVFLPRIQIRGGIDIKAFLAFLHIQLTTSMLDKLGRTSFH